MGMPSGEAKKDYALIGAIVSGPDAPWFFKLTGPAPDRRGEPRRLHGPHRLHPLKRHSFEGARRCPSAYTLQPRPSRARVGEPVPGDRRAGPAAERPRRASRRGGRAAAESPSAPPPSGRDRGDVVAIRGATVLTVTKGTIEGGTVIVRGGKIEAVGKDLPVPEGARVIEGQRRFLIPGIIDMHSHLGVYPWPGTEANSDGNEATDPNTAMVRALDSVWFEDPGDAARGRGRRDDHPGAPRIGQRHRRRERDPQAPRRGRAGAWSSADAPRGLKMAMGENPKGVYGARNVLPSTRMGNAFVMRDAYIKAAEYARKQARPTRSVAARATRTPARPTATCASRPSPTSCSGKVRVNVHCYRADEILQILDIANECGFKVASLHHALEAYKVADAIQAHGAGIATFADWWGYKFEAFDAIPQNAGLCMRKGVVTALKSDSADIVQRMNQEAAKTIQYSALDRDQALSLVTINPARLIGMDVADRLDRAGQGRGPRPLRPRPDEHLRARGDDHDRRTAVVFDRDRDYERFVARPVPFGSFPSRPGGGTGGRWTMSVRRLRRGGRSGRGFVSLARPARSGGRAVAEGSAARPRSPRSSSSARARSSRSPRSPSTDGSVWIKDGKIHQVGKIQDDGGGGRIMTCVDGCALQIRPDMPIVDAGGRLALPGDDRRAHGAGPDRGRQGGDGQRRGRGAGGPAHAPAPRARRHLARVEPSSRSPASRASRPCWSSPPTTASPTSAAET